MAHSNRMVLVALALLAAAAPPALAQWQIESKDGTSSVKLGLLLQGQYEGLETENAAGESSWSQNLFIRRARILLGGKMDKVSFFVETDSPNIGKWEKSLTATEIGKKNSGNIFIQDAWITYTWSDALMVDGGLFLLPISYQSVQGAATLLAVDYGPYAFQESTPSDQRVGRDYAVQLRGYPVGKRLEYRVGLAQGIRNNELDDEGNAVNENNQPLRAFGRLQWHVFEPHTGFFYTGTNFGEKKVLDVGASYATQGDWTTWSGSVFLDWPVGGNGLTFQADYVDQDGGTTLPFSVTPPTLGNLGREKIAFAEAGFFIRSMALMPYVHWSSVDYDDLTDLDTTRNASSDKLQFGFGWFPSGHKFNLKLAYAILGTERNAADVPDQHQLVFQAQFFHF